MKNTHKSKYYGDGQRLGGLFYQHYEAEAVVGEGR